MQKSRERRSSSVDRPRGFFITAGLIVILLIFFYKYWNTSTLVNNLLMQNSIFKSEIIGLKTITRNFENLKKEHIKCKEDINIKDNNQDKYIKLLANAKIELEASNTENKNRFSEAQLSACENVQTRFETCDVELKAVQATLREQIKSSAGKFCPTQKNEEIAPTENIVADSIAENEDVRKDSFNTGAKYTRKAVLTDKQPAKHQEPNDAGDVGEQINNEEPVEPSEEKRVKGMADDRNDRLEEAEPVKSGDTNKKVQTDEDNALKESPKKSIENGKTGRLKQNGEQHSKKDAVNLRSETNNVIERLESDRVGHNKKKDIQSNMDNKPQADLYHDKIGGGKDGRNFKTKKKGHQWANSSLEKEVKQETAEDIQMEWKGMAVKLDDTNDQNKLFPDTSGDAKFVLPIINKAADDETNTAILNMNGQSEGNTKIKKINGLSEKESNLPQDETDKGDKNIKFPKKKKVPTATLR